MENQPIRILIIEDNPADARIIKELLIDARSMRFELKNATTLAEGIAMAKEERFDVVLLDLGLPDSSGIDTFMKMHEATPALPILVMTGLNDETVAVNAMKMGAQDYIVKGQADGNLLARFIRYAVERKKVEKAVRRSKELFSKAFHGSPTIISIISLKDMRYIEINRAFEWHTGFGRDEVIGRAIRELGLWVNLEDLDRSIQDILSGGKFHDLESPFLTKNGEERIGLLSAELIEFAGEPCILIVAEDITERKMAEEGLHRSEERLRTVLSNAPILMFALDGKGVFTLLKGKQLEKLRIRPEEADEIIGSSIFEIFPDIPEILNKTRQALRGENVGCIIEVSESVFELWFSPMKDEQGKVTGIIGVATDITERKRVEEELTMSKERYQGLVEETGLGMASMDKKGTFTFVNSTLSKMAGYSEEEMVGKNIADIVHPDDKKKIVDVLGKIAMRPRGKFPIEYRMIHKDGQALYVYSRPTAILENNLMVGFSTYIQDITERKETEMAFQESQQMMKAVVETSPSMMVLTDPEGRIVLFNGACEEITGYKRDEVMGKTIEELFLPEKWKPIVRERFSDPYSTKLHDPHENPWLTKKGEERLIEWRCTVMPSPKDDRPFILGIGIDITERRRLESIMMQAQKMDSLGNLAAGIAHDFNNILTAILTHAELAKRQLDSGNFTPDSLGKKIDTMMTAGKRAKDLTQKLLGLSRQGKYNPQNIDVNGVIKEAADLLGKGFTSTTHYDIDCKTDAMNYIFADATQVLMVVQNLVLNARDAMPDGGKITISSEDVTAEGFRGRFDDIPSGSYVKLTVADTGTGIPDDALPRIFEPFFTTKEKGKGTGLGLSMVWGIVKNHHGFIEVRTETDKGSTFEVYLPAVSRKKVKQAEDAKAESERKQKILVVDDEDMIRESAQEYLTSLGYDVAVASSGKEGLEKFKEDDVDLVITDLIMKEMDGPELFKRIRELDPSAKVYVMSGFSQDSKVQGMIAAGAAGFISKPFDLDELEKTVKFALSKR